MLKKIPLFLFILLLFGNCNSFIINGMNNNEEQKQNSDSEFDLCRLVKRCGDNGELLKKNIETKYPMWVKPDGKKILWTLFNLFATDSYCISENINISFLGKFDKDLLLQKNDEGDTLLTHILDMIYTNLCNKNYCFFNYKCLKFIKYLYNHDAASFPDIFQNIRFNDTYVTHFEYITKILIQQIDEILVKETSKFKIIINLFEILACKFSNLYKYEYMDRRNICCLLPNAANITTESLKDKIISILIRNLYVEEDEIEDFSIAHCLYLENKKQITKAKNQIDMEFNIAFLDNCSGFDVILKYLYRKDDLPLFKLVFNCSKLKYHQVLRSACFYNSKSIFNYIINQKNIYIYEITLHNILYYAIFHNRKDFVIKLIKIGCPLNKQIKGGMSALQLAVTKGNKEMAKILLNQKAIPDITKKKTGDNLIHIVTKKLCGFSTRELGNNNKIIKKYENILNYLLLYEKTNDLVFDKNKKNKYPTDYYPNFFSIENCRNDKNSYITESKEETLNFPFNISSISKYEKIYCDIPHNIENVNCNQFRYILQLVLIECNEIIDEKYTLPVDKLISFLCNIQKYHNKKMILSGRKNFTTFLCDNVRGIKKGPARKLYRKIEHFDLTNLPYNKLDLDLSFIFKLAIDMHNKKKTPIVSEDDIIPKLKYITYERSIGLEFKKSFKKYKIGTIVSILRFVKEIITHNKNQYFYFN